MKTMQRTFIPHIEANHYSSVPAQIGDLMAFRHCVPHFGTAHTGAPGSPPRVQSFCMLSAKPDPTGQDSFQYYPWHLARDSFGLCSVGHLSSLVAGSICIRSRVIWWPATGSAFSTRCGSIQSCCSDTSEPRTRRCGKRWRRMRQRMHRGEPRRSPPGGRSYGELHSSCGHHGDVSSTIHPHSRR